MSIATQSVLFNALPLLVLAGAYLVVAAALVPLAWRDRADAHALDIAMVAVFPAVAVVSSMLGVLVLRDREPVGGHVWIAFAAVCIGLVPPLMFFVRWRDRALAATGVRRSREAEQLATMREREVASLAAISTALARARDLESAALPLVQQVRELLGVEFAGVALVNEDATLATGVVGVLEGEELGWFRDLRLDLRDEPSGIASAVFEAAPVTAYDCRGATNVNRRLADLVGAESGVWVPIVAEDRVVGVLMAVTTSVKRAFAVEEISILQALAGETALALERLSSAGALAEALAREQRIAAIARRMRGALTTDEVIRVVTEELCAALGLDGVSVELGDGDAPGLPIRVGDSRVGTLALGPSGPLAEGDRLLLDAVVRELGLALQSASLVAEKQRRLVQQEALLQAAQVVSSELELEVVLERLVEEMAKLLHADAADCFLLDGERRVLRCAAVHGLDESLVGLELPADQGVSGQALERGRPVVVAERAEIEAQAPHEAYLGFSHVLAAPMVWGGDVRGVLEVGNRDAAAAFERSDVELLETFAGLASVALRNAESLRESRHQERVQRAFFRIASLLSEPLSLAETFDVAAQAACEALGGDFAVVLSLERDLFAIAGGYALPAHVRDLPPPGVLRQAALDGRAIASARLAGDERFEEAWRQGPFSSLVAAPLEGATRGLVVVFFEDVHAGSADDLELARQVGRATRAALERSRLYETERTARALSQHLARTGSLLGRELDPGAVLDEVVEQAVALLGADAGAVAVLEQGELVVAAARGDAVEGAIGSRTHSTGWLGGDVVQMHTPVAREQVAEAALVEADPLLSLGHSAYLGVPLVARDGSILGVLSLYGRAPRAWREDEVEALGALAANASVALANAELYQTVALEHERTVAILANVADGIVAVDRDGRVVVWNAAAEAITGVPSREAVGATPAEVLQRELHSDTEGTQRLLSIDRAGEEVWLSLSEAIMRDPTGGVAGRIFAFRDISAERFVERMKSEFVSTVSHELRTPLTSIYGFAATLLRADIGFSEEERGTFLGYIASESERLTKILDELLDVARLDSGRLELDLRPTDVRSAIGEVVPADETDAILQGHRVVLDVPDDVPDVRADAVKLRQVLNQLIENALKYSPEGGTVRVEARSSNGAVAISVEDEGVGIPASRLDRIFDKFAVGNDSLPGSGLGLFVAQGLVTAMGGKIRVNSKEGEGSRFTFELPVAVRGDERA